MAVTKGFDKLGIWPRWLDVVRMSSLKRPLNCLQSYYWLNMVNVFWVLFLISCVT